MDRRTFLALAFASAARAAGGPTLTLEKIRQIEKLISAEMSRQSIPGLTMALGLGDDVRWSRAYGLSDLENFVPAKVFTVYRTASLAKPMTATAAMQLVDAGKLDLDAPVQKYVPDFPEKQWPVTTRQLLAHTGGIRSYRDAAEEYNTRHYESAREAMQQFAADDLACEPGTHYLYSSFGFVLAGAVIESISGVRFSEYLRRNLFEPADMRDTYLDDVYELIPNRSRGYRRTENGRIVNATPIDTSNRTPGGGLASTPDDILRFVFALPKLVKPESLAAMWKPQTTKDGKSTGYGLGWGVGEFQGRMRVNHHGGQAGVSAMLWFFPFERVAIVAMCNLEGVSWDALFEAAAQMLVA